MFSESVKNAELVTEQYSCSASSAAGHGWNTGQKTKAGYKAVFAQVGSGGGYNVQPVLEAMSGLGTSTISVAGSAAQASSDIRVWVLWVKE